ncbi:hypothetical protein TorRG33x02_222760 [Trema orientale]|uniref:Uncharacterized protein n=1 Tax=Trema orientale TaxID=63057 RepID=A0A2P5E8T4_TREOI|nr:hypothetical protein TorRG33x02_222760 [Trema orientale]
MKKLEHLFKVAEDAHKETHDKFAARQLSTEEKLAQLTVVVVELSVKIDKLTDHVLQRGKTLESCQPIASIPASTVTHLSGSSSSQQGSLSTLPQDVRTSPPGLLPTPVQHSQVNTSSVTTSIATPIGFNIKYLNPAPTVAPTEPAYRFMAPQGRYMAPQQPQHRHFPQYYYQPRPPRAHNTDVTKKVKIEAPEFDGRLDPSAFLDWLAAMDEYFDWYNLDDEQRIRFAKMKLKGHAKLY